MVNAWISKKSISKNEKGNTMKLLKFMLLFSLLLAACQPAPTTPTPAANTPPAPTRKAATPKVTGTAGAKRTPTASPTPNGPVTHRYGKDPNASSYLVVKDQLIVNNSLTIDTVIASQAEFIVLYKDKEKRGKHSLGQQIIFAAIPAGTTHNLVIPLSQNLNPGINPTVLPGTLVDVVLQTDPTKSITMIQLNTQVVEVTFSIIDPGNDNPPSIFPTPTP
jgi:hypothetical protein